MIVEYVLSYEVTSPGEVEDIEGRLRATNPTTLDTVLNDEHDPVGASTLRLLGLVDLEAA